jgi:tetratricopeptide (TPR) repeat protein
MSAVRRTRPVLGSLALLCALASAMPHARADEPRGRAELWTELEAPQLRRARELLRQALRLANEARRTLPTDLHGLCVRALSLHEAPTSLSIVRGTARAVRTAARPALQRRAHLEAALARLALAQRLAPDDGEIQLTTARLLAEWEEPAEPWTCASQRRDAEALTSLQALRSAHPELAPEATGFELAIALTRQQRFTEAAQTWTGVSTLVADGGEQSVTVRTNLAETSMLAGDLETAIEQYRRALAIASSGRSYQLALWGLAIALDRLGEHAEARTHVEKALHAEGWAMRALRSEGVFFEPEHELHYYEALGHELLAEREQGDRLGELAQACTSYRAFLRGDGGGGRFADTAEAGLARVTAALKAERARKRGARVASPLTPRR